MHDKTPTLERRIERLAALDVSRNKSQTGSGSVSNTNTTPKVRPRKMDSMTGGKIVKAGTSKDNGLTCYTCSQVGHISHNCPKCDLRKILLTQALVGKDAPSVKSG